MDVGELAPGLWWWTTRHPEWSADFGWAADVRCFYVETDDLTLVVDPLVPADEEERFWSALDADVERRGHPVAVLLTESAHARSAGSVATRYGGGVWGHRDASAKIAGVPFHVVSPGDEVPGARALPFDHEPESSGTPLYFPSHRALAVGDTFIAVDSELRVWWNATRRDDGWLDRRLVPSLRTWLDLPIDYVLVSHGDPASFAKEDLAAALDGPPYRGV